MERFFDAMEGMTDRFDRASTLNFTTVARVIGSLSSDNLARAARLLVRKHPLLGAAIVRDTTPPRFIEGAAADIAVTCEQASAVVAQDRIADSLEHSAWPDAGPRARVHMVQHSDGVATIMLTLHHTVSDGSSGIIAMRDLLALTQGIDLGPPIPSPGPRAFLPKAAADATEQAKAMFARLSQGGPCVRPHDGEASLEHRRGVQRRLLLSFVQSKTLLDYARSASATVQGILVATVARALASEWGHEIRQRISHPVSLRRYLPEWDAALPAIGDAVGYYVSAIETVHQVAPTSNVGALAREISASIASEKRNGSPLLTGPVSAVAFVEATEQMTDDAFRELAEKKIMLSTFGLSNLGRLEALDAKTRVGHLEIEDLYFASANSIFSALGGSASTFDGRLSLHLRAVTPLVSRERFERIVGRVEQTFVEMSGLTPAASGPLKVDDGHADFKGERSPVANANGRAGRTG